MDAGQRAAELKVKGKKRAACGCSTLAGRFNRRSRLGSIAAVCLAELATTLFNTAFYSNKQVDDFLAQD